jgi:hypothetical protein
MTVQSLDQIIIDGRRRDLVTNPLEMYREKYRPDMVFFQASPNTSCWRGYIAEWEIDDGKLFLLKVDGYVSYKGRNPNIEVKEDIRWGELHPELFQDKIPITLSELFGHVSERVPATWYSGELRLVSGGGWGDDLSYQTISVKDGICGELKGVDGAGLDDTIPF